MTHDVAALCRFMLDYLEKITHEMTSEDLLTGTGGANPPGWILGHLAIVADACPYLKMSRKCPLAWHKAFSPKSVPSSDMPQQTPAEWMATIRTGYERVLAALPTIDATQLSEPHGFAILADTKIETKGQLLMHILTTHLATHIGQLSAWRRTQGQQPLF